MVIKLPIEGRWSQSNESDKFGSLWASKNLNFDEEGYLKLSPRTVLIDGADYNAQFGVPLFIGRWASGEYLVATSNDAVFNVSISSGAFGSDENTGTANPTLTPVSHGIFFGNLFYATTTSGLLHRAISADHTVTWTAASGVSGITAGVRHFLEIFRSRGTICISNDNKILQYSSDYHITAPTHTASTTLTIPADFEVTGMAYNNQKIGIVTRMGTSSAGSGKEAYFFLWDGSTTAAQQSAGVGSDTCLGICAYKGSFAVLTRTGQLLYWNGGGFDVLANFPFYYTDNIIAGFPTLLTYGSVMEADGDVIYINLPNRLEEYSRKGEAIIGNCLHGVWCFDPKVGLYHRWSPSISPAYFNQVTAGNVNTSTDIFTISSGTIPKTGNIARITSLTTLGGFTLNSDYYVIKLTATTFQLASTRANALARTAIDITSVSGTTSFWMYDLIDYGTNISVLETGAISAAKETRMTNTDILIGGEYYNTGLSIRDVLCIGVPFLENRGWGITVKIFSSQVTDQAQKLFIKFRPLKSGDSIIVKYRNREIDGLPVVSFGSTGSAKAATWSTDKTFTSQQDLSEAKTYFDGGGELECELVAGAGAGSIEKITALTLSGSTYTVTLANDVIGVEQNRKSEFIISNWKIERTITSSNADVNNFAEIPLGGQASWMQFKIELRGSEIAIEELEIISAVDKQSV